MNCLAPIAIPIEREEDGVVFIYEKPSAQAYVAPAILC